MGSCLPWKGYEIGSWTRLKHKGEALILLKYVYYCLKCAYQCKYMLNIWYYAIQGTKIMHTFASSNKNN